MQFIYFRKIYENNVVYGGLFLFNLVVNCDNELIYYFSVNSYIVILSLRYCLYNDRLDVFVCEGYERKVILGVFNMLGGFKFMDVIFSLCI